MFRNYAESNRGFKSFQVQVSTASLEQQRRRDQQQVEYLKENARFAASNSRDFLAALDSKHRTEMAWRKELKDFYDMNAEHIFEAEKMELKARLDAAEYKTQNPGGTPGQPSTLEKIQPFLQLAGKAVGMMAEAHEARVKEEVEADSNFIRNSEIDTKTVNFIGENREVLYGKTEERIEARRQVYEMSGKSGFDPNDNELWEREFPEQTLYRINNATGKDLEVYQSLQVLNAYGKYEPFVSNMKSRDDVMLTLPDGGQISYKAVFSNDQADPKLINLGLQGIHNLFTKEFEVDTVPLSVPLDPYVRKMKDSVHNKVHRVWSQARKEIEHDSTTRLVHGQLQNGMKTGDHKKIKDYVRMRQQLAGAVLNPETGELYFTDKNTAQQARTNILEDLTVFANLPGVTTEAFTAAVRMIYDDPKHPPSWEVKELIRVRTLNNEKAIADAHRNLEGATNDRYEQIRFDIAHNEETRKFLGNLSDNEVRDYLRDAVGIEKASELMSLWKSKDKGVSTTQSQHEKLVNQTSLKQRTTNEFTNHYEKIGRIGISATELNKNPHFNQLIDSAIRNWNERFTAEYNNNGGDARAAESHANAMLEHELESGNFDPTNLYIGNTKALTAINKLEFKGLPTGTITQDPLQSQVIENINKFSNMDELERKVETNIKEIIPVDRILPKAMRNGVVDINVLSQHPAVKRLDEALPKDWNVKNIANRVIKAGGLEGVDPLLVTDRAEMARLSAKHGNYAEFYRTTKRTMEYMQGVNAVPPSNINAQLNNAVRKTFGSGTVWGGVNILGPDEFGLGGGPSHSGPKDAHLDGGVRDKNKGNYIVTGLQKLGYEVTEHPLAGGITTDRHVRGEFDHYKGYKWDIPYSQFGSGSLTDVDRQWTVKLEAAHRALAHGYENGISIDDIVRQHINIAGPNFKELPQQAAPAVQPQQTYFPKWLTPQKALEKAREYGDTPAGEYWLRIADIIARQRREAGVGS